MSDPIRAAAGGEPVDGGSGGAVPAETACSRFAEELAAFAYGDSSGAERDALEAHLGGCAPCRAELDAIRAVSRDLDDLDVPEPSAAAWAVLESRLETRVAPLRAERLAGGSGRGWWSVARRVAAAILIGGLSVSATWLARDNRRLQGENDVQREHIAVITRDLGDVKFRAGDLRGAFERYAWALSNGVELSAEQERRLGAQERLVALPEDIARAWNEAQREDLASQRRLLAEILWHHPEHAFADEAFLVLSSSAPSGGGPERPARLRPLEEVAQQPLSAVRPPLPSATAEAHYRAELARLEGAAADLPLGVRLWPRYRAGRLAEEELGDLAAAAERYRQVAREADKGPLRDLAAKRLAAVERKQ